MYKPKTITKPQIAAYFRAANAAARALGEPLDAYRKRVMQEVCNVTSLKQLDRTHDFDRCMARFAEDAGDYELASKFVVGDAHRMAFLVSVMCGQVLQLNGCPGGTTAERDYLAGIIGRANIQCGGDPRDPSYWLDVAPDSLRSLFAMLDTHRRRLLRRLGGGSFAAFDPDVSYTLKPGGGVIIVKSPPCAGGAAWPQ
jgi:hypothetical protein